jgi:hypothetical protein
MESDMSLAWFDTTTLEHLKLIFSALVVVGFLLTSFQIKAARRQARANVLLKMIDEWSSLELYESVRYIHQLREEWKSQQPDPSKWGELAKSWVECNAPQPAADAADSWIKRRRVSQFLSKMGYMLKSAYITRDDFFGVAPEARRTDPCLEFSKRGFFMLWICLFDYGCWLIPYVGYFVGWC